jgi:hypothetical protein
MKKQIKSRHAYVLFVKDSPFKKKVVKSKKAYCRKRKYDANEDDAVEAYHLLNKYVFDNVLNCPKFNIKRTRGYWGMCDGRMDMSDERFFVEEIILSKKFTHKAMFVATLAHEMVHQWQWEVLSPQRYEEGKTPIMSHGPSFYAWRKPLHKYLIPLTRAY